jgi:RNA recognition motif-containing protein
MESKITPRMSFTVFLGNLPAWVTADDIRAWLSAENLVADAIKVIRNPETQESKGFAFIEAPNTEEMNSIIRRFDRAPLEDRLLRANPAQPPKPRGATRVTSGPGGPGGPPSHGSTSHSSSNYGNAGYSNAGHGASVQAASNQTASSQPASSHQASAPPVIDQRPPRRGKKSVAKKPAGSGGTGSSSAFAEELAKAL